MGRDIDWYRRWFNRLVENEDVPTTFVNHRVSVAAAYGLRDRTAEDRNPEDSYVEAIDINAIDYEEWAENLKRLQAPKPKVRRVKVRNVHPRARKVRVIDVSPKTRRVKVINLHPRARKVRVIDINAPFDVDITYKSTGKINVNIEVFDFDLDEEIL